MVKMINFITLKERVLYNLLFLNITEETHTANSALEEAVEMPSGQFHLFLTSLLRRSLVREVTRTEWESLPFPITCRSEPLRWTFSLWSFLCASHSCGFYSVNRFQLARTCKVHISPSTCFVVPLVLITPILKWSAQHAWLLGLKERTLNQKLESLDSCPRPVPHRLVTSQVVLQPRSTLSLPEW